MSSLNHKRTTSSLAPPIFYVAKKWQLKDRRFPITPSKHVMVIIQADNGQNTWTSLIDKYCLKCLDLCHNICFEPYHKIC